MPNPVPTSPRARVWLLGLMGAGKTTIGRLLAAQLGCPYIDNDAQLVTESGRSADALEHVEGVATLHQRELDGILQVTHRPPPFVAGVAASVADDPAGLDALVATGFTVYLFAPPDVLAARVGSGAGRPLLGGEPQSVLQQQFDRRDPVLRRIAALTVDTAATPPRDAADLIASRLGSG